MRRNIVFQVNSDEEMGSESSRKFTEEAARHSAVVLVVEPGTGLKGKLKTARKGIGDYTVTVKGRASHAGVDFEAGASAVVELARQIQRIAAFTRSGAGHDRQPGRDFGRHALERRGRGGAGRGRYPHRAREGRRWRSTKNSAP